MIIMRKKIAVALALIFILTVMPVGMAHAQAASGNYDWVKVKLSTQNASTLSIPVKGSYFINENGASFSGGVLTLAQSGGSVTVAHSQYGTLYTGASCQIMRENVSPSAGYLQIPTIYGNRCYLGHLNVKPTSAGLQVVNVVPLAHYLYGVVGHEMSDAFPLEALKAQAVASKCYILSSISTTGDYYLGDTSSDQVYKGYDSTASNVIRAVDSTIDVVLTTGSGLLRTYYAASNGGETNLVSYAWSGRGSDAGYGMSIDDFDFANPSSLKETVFFPYGSGVSMNVNLYTYLLNLASSAAGQSVSSIVSINSVQAHTPKYSSSNRNLTKARVNMTVALASLSRTKAFGTPSGFSSTFGSSFNNTSSGFGGGNSTSFGGFNNSSGFGSTTTTNTTTPTAGSVTTTSVSDASGTMTLEFDFNLADLSTYGVVTNASLRIFWGEPANGGYNIYHVRYGHGVGMSQRGAQQRATAGQSYKKILSFYYPSASLTTITVNAPQNPVKPVLAATPVAYGVTTAKNVNLRKTASTKGKRVTKLKKGAELTIYSESDGWYYVTSGKYTGYISGEYVEITQTVQPAAPVEQQLPAQTGNVTTPSGFGTTGFGMTTSGTTGFGSSGFGSTVNTSSVSQGLTPVNNTGFGTNSTTTTQTGTAAATPTVGGVMATPIAAGVPVYSDISASVTLGTLSAQQQVTITAQNGNFYKITSGTLTGYVLKTNLNVLGSIG